MIIFGEDWDEAKSALYSIKNFDHWNNLSIVHRKSGGNVEITFLGVSQFQDITVRLITVERLFKELEVRREQAIYKSISSGTVYPVSIKFDFHLPITNWEFEPTILYLTSKYMCVTVNYKKML